MNDVLNIAREGVVGGLGLIEVLKTANVRAGIETEQEELEAAIESARQHFLDVLRVIDDAEEDSAPNCGARNR